MPGPLAGVRVVELAGIGPGPHAAMLLADLGADVVRVERPGGGTELVPPEQDHVLRNRRSVHADLKEPGGLRLVLELVDRADVLLEGYRPGVAERLGVGPDDCLARNPRLVYGRMTGWGRTGELAPWAGHDINYLALTGALDAVGHAGQRPLPALNLVGDLGGGSMFLVTGVVSALFERERSGHGQVVDAAIVDGVGVLMQMIWSLHAHGSWSPERGTNLIDTGAPFYDTYRCRDGRYVAVGAIEPAFYRVLLHGLGLSAVAVPDRADRRNWPALRELLTRTFATRDRDDWARVFAGTDACVTPVLSLAEAAAHPHLTERDTIRSKDGTVQAMPAPRFSRTMADDPVPPPEPGSGLAALRRDWGLSDD